MTWLIEPERAGQDRVEEPADLRCAVEVTEVSGGRSGRAGTGRSSWRQPVGSISAATSYVAGFEPEHMGAFMAGVEVVAEEVGLPTPMPPASLIGVTVLFEPDVLVELEATAVLDRAGARLARRPLLTPRASRRLEPGLGGPGRSTSVARRERSPALGSPARWTTPG